MLYLFEEEAMASSKMSKKKGDEGMKKDMPWDKEGGMHKKGSGKMPMRGKKKGKKE